MTKTESRSARRQQNERGRKVTPRRSNDTVKWIIGGVVLLVLIGVGVALLRGGSAGSIAGLQTFSNLSRDHVSTAVTYPQTPPVGGAHNPVWENCGIYDQPIPNESGVHSLEHGAVWITYQPTLPTDQVDALRKLVAGHRYALLSPYAANLPSPVVASAWGVQVQVPNASDARLATFLSTYEQGPQTPEPGASCVGGNGTPVAH